MAEVRHLEVSAAEAGQKLLQFLERRLHRGVPRAALLRCIRTGQVRVDGGRRKPFDRLEAGQIVRVPPLDPGEARAPLAVAGELRVLFENEEVIAVAKPAGLAAHPGTGHGDSVDSRLKARFADASFAPALVHRLDRDTSGLLLAAKTHAALRRLTTDFREGRTRKTYLAWVRGTWPEDGETLLEDRLEKRGGPGRERVRTGGGKIALARVAPLLVGQEESLLAVRLLTGRTHQIRVQLAARGHAVLGDAKYGTPDPGGLHLHSLALDVPGLALNCPPPWRGERAVAAKTLEAALRAFPD